MRSTLSGAKSGVVEDAALLTSELVADAMLHPGSDPQLSIDTMENRIRVEVLDFDLTSRDIDRVRLRGWVLLMMNALATSWGIESRSDCRVVWFDLSF
jgi:hypothetical protein